MPNLIMPSCRTSMCNRVISMTEQFSHWKINSTCTVCCVLNTKFIVSWNHIKMKCKCKCLRPTWPCLDVSEQSISGTGRCNILTMAEKAISRRKASPISCANHESLCSGKDVCWWKNAHEISHEAESNGPSVETRRVSSSAIPSATFINDVGVTDAKVVANISPTVGILMIAKA